MDGKATERGPLSLTEKGKFEQWSHHNIMTFRLSESLETHTCKKNMQPKPEQYAILFVCRIYWVEKIYGGQRSMYVFKKLECILETLGLHAGALSQSRRTLLCGLSRRHQQHGLSDWRAWFAFLTVNIVPGIEIMLFVPCCSLFWGVIRQKNPHGYFTRISSSNVLQVIILL